MENNKKNSLYIKFRINYQTIFEEAIYIIGNIPQLGCWNIRNACRLTWNQQDNWIGSIQLEDIPQLDIEYKYCIASYNQPDVVSKWEDGYNRTISLKKLTASYLDLDEVWNHRKVLIRLIDPKGYLCQSEDQDMYIVGNCWDLGNSEKLQLMKRNIDKEYQQQGGCWEKLITISFHKDVLRFNLAQFDKKTKHLNWDRIIRKMIFSKCNLQLIKPSFYYYIIDNFNLNFCINQIDENIIIGPYPQGESDINILKQKGVSCIINLQTDKEMTQRGISLDYLQPIYENKGINTYHFPIIDMDVIDMNLKLNDAVHLVDILVKKYHIIYIHCLEGIYRSPQVVIAYYYNCKHMNLKEAINKIEEKHPKSKKNRDYLEKVMGITLNQIQIN